LSGTGTLKGSNPKNSLLRRLRLVALLFGTRVEGRERLPFTASPLSRAGWPHGSKMSGSDTFKALNVHEYNQAMQSVVRVSGQDYGPQQPTSVFFPLWLKNKTGRVSWACIPPSCLSSDSGSGCLGLPGSSPSSSPGRCGSVPSAAADLSTSSATGLISSRRRPLCPSPLGRSCYKEPDTRFNGLVSDSTVTVEPFDSCNPISSPAFSLWTPELNPACPPVGCGSSGAVDSLSLPVVIDEREACV
jgi:hypothetical protein